MLNENTAYPICKDLSPETRDVAARFGRNSCPRLRPFFIGSRRVDVSQS